MSSYNNARAALVPLNLPILSISTYKGYTTAASPTSTPTGTFYKTSICVLFTKYVSCYTGSPALAVEIAARASLPRSLILGLRLAPTAWRLEPFGYVSTQILFRGDADLIDVLIGRQ